MDYRDTMDIGRLKLEPGIQDLILRALNPREPVEAKIGQDGQFTVDMFKKEKPKGEGGEKKPGGETAKPTTPQAGFGPAIAALTGPSGGPGVKELAGLTPEQIVSVMGMEARKRELEQGTISQLLDLPYRQAQTKKLLRPEKPATPVRGTVVKGEKTQWLVDPVTKEKTDLGIPVAAPTDTPTRLDFWINGEKQSIMVPKSKFNESIGKVMEAGGKLEAPGEDAKWRLETPLRLYDDLASFLVNKEGEVIDVPDESGIEALNSVAQKQGHEVVAFPIDAIVRKWAKLDFLAKDIPARDIYMIVKKGKDPTKEDVIRSMVGMYGYTQEQAEQALR